MLAISPAIASLLSAVRILIQLTTLDSLYAALMIFLTDVHWRLACGHADGKTNRISRFAFQLFFIVYHNPRPK